MATISPPPRRPIGDGGNGPAPTYAHAVEAFLIAHDRAGAWSAGTAVKYRQSLAILGSRLSEDPTGASVAALDTPAGAAALAAAFTAAFATLAPATRARHLAALRPGLVAGPGLAGHRPRRRLGPTQDRPRPQPGTDPRPDHRPVAPGRRPTREDPVAAAL